MKRFQEFLPFGKGKCVNSVPNEEAIDIEHAHKWNEQIGTAKEVSERPYDYLHHKKEEQLEDIEYALLIEKALHSPDFEQDEVNDTNKLYG